jgi:hypothetical protein
LAVSASRNADSRKSMVAPVESMARYKEHSDPSPERRFRPPARTCLSAKMVSQSLLQLGAVTLHPAPDRGVIDLETTLLQQPLNIAQRKRIAKILPYRAKV